MTNHRSPLAKARDEWMESDDGQKCLGPEILSRPADSQFLRNRLVRAFIAGAEAQATILMDKSLENMMKKAEGKAAP